MTLFSSSVFWLSLGSIALSVLLFFILPLLGLESTTACILVSLLPLLLGTVFWLILRIFRLKKAIKSKDGTNFETSPFDSQLATPWQEPLRKQTSEALEVLRSSAKGKSGAGRNPLDLYRFYLLLGNEGSGKTTLLENSGIHFPRRFPSAAELARQTQNFTQWWFSGQGIFLEAPARYLDGQEGDEELRYWLTQLRRDGKSLALDAILLTVSFNELLEGEVAAAKLAAKQRERLALILGTLKLELPIYLVFTHSDILPGYFEFFDNLKEPDDQQVFGATLALKGTLASARNRFEREYRKIWDVLTARVPYRLAQVENKVDKQKVFAFPNEFGATQERLAAFVDQLFKDTMNRERAMFRGFFLCSVTPAESSPIASDAMFEDRNASHPLDIRSKMRPQGNPASLTPIAGKSRSFFTQLLFNGVLKSDRSLAQIPGYRLGSLSRRAVTSAAAISLVSLCIIGYGIAGYLIGGSRLRHLAETSETAARIRWNNTSAFDREFAVFSDLAAQIDSLKTGDNSSWLIPPGFGHSSSAADLASQLHAVLFERLVMRDVTRNLSASLEMAAKYYNPVEHSTLRESLRLYLLLTSEGKPHLEDIEAADMAALLTSPVSQEIQHKMGVENLPPNFEAALEPHLLLWSKVFVKTKRPELEKTNTSVVQSVRTAISGNPSIDALFNSIVAGEEPTSDLTLQSMGVPGDGIIKSNAKVRGFFTKDAFDNGAMDRLAEGAEEPHRKDWVLGDQSAANLPPEMQDKQKLGRALIDRFFEEYAAEWNRFLQSLIVRVPADPAQAAGKLAGFASANQGLPVVLSRLLVEVNLFAPPSAAGNEAQKKMKESKFNKLAQMVMASRDADKKVLQAKFKFVEELLGPGGSGGALQDYFNSVRGLSEVLNRIALSGDGAGENLEAAQQLFQGKVDNPLNIAWMEASKTRTRYESQVWLGPLLEGPVRDVAGNLVETAARNLEALYTSKVLPFYNQNLKGRYPIARNATLDVNVEDLKAFFAPENGIFPTFLNGKMGPFIKPSDQGLALATWNGIRLPMNTATLTSLSQTHMVGKRTAGETPGAFKVHNLNLTLPESRNTTRVTLRMGDDKISVAPGEVQGRQTLRWPSETSYKGAEIVVEAPGGSQNKRGEGAFGLLKLLDGARALNLRPGGFTAKWRFTVAQKYDVDVSLDANIPDRENPFSTTDFFKFELPAKLMTGGAVTATP